MDDERLRELITLSDFGQLAGLSREAVLNAMDDLAPEVDDLYSLPVLVLCCCGGRLPDAAALAGMRARSRVLDAPDGETYLVLAGPPDPELPSPSPFD